MWYTKTKDEYVYVTNNTLDIKIGKIGKKYVKRLAKTEVIRRNLNPKAEGIEFSKEDIFNMTKYFVRLLTNLYKLKYEIKLDVEETESIALYVFCRCQKHFVPGETLFVTYFYRAVAKEIYRNHFNKDKSKKKNKFRVSTINDKVIKQAKHSTLKMEEKEDSIYVNLNVLPVRYREIITEYFYKKRSFQSIADELGVTKQRIQQITKKCLNILKDQFVE